MKNKIIEHLFSIIKRDLPKNLFYHGLHHTIDVHNVCKFYIQYYNLDKKDAELLEIAAVGHDMGFIETYKNHEEFSAQITSKIMAEHGYSLEERERVSKIIKATKIPQSPTCFLGEILCDADLDYLGRYDFELTGLSLKKEWEIFKIFPDLDNTFNQIQVGFLKSHFYHTDYALKNRNPVKLQHLASISKKNGSA